MAAITLRESLLLREPEREPEITYKPFCNFERMLALAEEAKKYNTIPRIIHKIWWQSIDALPAKYVEPLTSWTTHNPEWEIVVWDEQTIEALLSHNFPEYKDLFNGYSRMIQKIDVAKYFILATFGGCYSDMDQLCLNPIDMIVDVKREKASIVASAMTERKSLIFLTSSFSFLKPPYCNNAFIISKADLSVWQVVFKQLEHQAHSYTRKLHVFDRVSAEVHVLRSTGPVCFTKAVRSIMRSKPKQSIRIMDSMLVEPFSVYFKLGDEKNFDQLLASICEKKESVAVSSITSSWTNVHARQPVYLKAIKLFIANKYKKEIDEATKR